MDRENVAAEEEGDTRAGYVALLGSPNAGKSTLLNRLLEQKLSIVSRLPQTTRERVVGIETRGGVQMIFLDTPGLLDPRYLLQESMLHAALHASSEADVVVVLIDALQRLPLPGAEPFQRLSSRSKTVIAAINKIDLASEEQLASARRWFDESGFANRVEISALEGSGVETLRETIGALLPPSPYLYPPEEISSQPVRFFVAEFVREAILELFQEEIPYSVAVRVDEFRETAEPLYIRATIFVERPSQKGILIGAKGAAIREIGTSARAKIEAFLGSPVYLDLWVKVLPRWRKDPGSLRHLGYPLPPRDHA